MVSLQDKVFVYQRFSGESFVQICRLLDVCTLEVSSLQWGADLLAAGVMSYFFGEFPDSKHFIFAVIERLARDQLRSLSVTWYIKLLKSTKIVIKFYALY